MTNTPRHFSALAKRSSDPPISWLMKLALDRPDLISLAVGFTDNETLPVEEVGALTRAILQRPKTARAALQYGTTIGLLQLRHELLRRWQGQDRITNHQSPITSDDVIVTDGSQQLLYLSLKFSAIPATSSSSKTRPTSSISASSRQWAFGLWDSIQFHASNPNWRT